MIIILQNGGLGNQLFQLCYGLSEFSTQDIYLDSYSTKLHRAKKSEMQKLFLPNNVKLFQKKRNRLILKLFSKHLLHLSLSRDSKVSLFRKIVDYVGTYLATLYFMIRYHGSIEIYCEGFLVTKKLVNPTNRLYVGYFQTENFPKKIDKNQLVGLFINADTHVKIQELKELSNQRKIIVMHLRFGDYINDLNIGNLSVEYFTEAINYLESKNVHNEIWIFSDNEAKAKYFLPSRFKNQTKIISTTHLSPVVALRCMQFGSGYILSNSTFSWWGAYLRQNSKAPVVVPARWFDKLVWSASLIPKGWYRVENDF